ncbi:MAG: ribonuclease HII [Prevotella sp.]|nr:ribonuclease HII [Prevotella sp.]MCM1075498.1 ribonuclease HII [Ruminococcus sp.]
MSKPKEPLRPFMQAGRLEAGCDEAGRGCLAGPVACAAVILPEGFFHPLLTDSKKLTEAQRDTLRPIIEKQSIAWSVVMVSAAEIDEINILNASILGMQRAVTGLKIRPDHILVDGNRFKPHPDGIPHTTVVHGDALYASIAAASILAKTHRDELMSRLFAEYPQYNWLKNKAYPTKEHRAAIAEHGPCPEHRRTFKLLP